MRTKQFNVSPDVSEAFWALAKMEAGDAGLCHSPPDEIVDTVLRQYINIKYPQLFEQLATHQKEVDALEKQLIEGLTKAPEPKELLPNL